MEPEEARAWEWLSTTYLQEPSDPSDREQRNRIRQSMLAQAESYVYASRQPGPPTQLSTILRRRGVTRLVETNLGFRDGLLLSGAGGLEVRVNSDCSSSRRRAATAHELGHTFFFDLSASPPKRRASFPRTRYWVEEGIARELGRAMLLPQRWLKADGLPAGDSISIQALRKFGERYDVSLELLLYRLSRDLGVLDAIVAFAAIETVEPLTLRIPGSGRFKGKSYRGFRMPEHIARNDKLTELAGRIDESDPRPIVSVYDRPWDNPGSYRLEIARHSNEGASRFVILLKRTIPKLRTQTLPH